MSCSPNLVEFFPTRGQHGPVGRCGCHRGVLRHGAGALLSRRSRSSSGHRVLVTATGLFERLSELRTGFVDLNQDDVRRVRLGSYFMGLRDLALPVRARCRSCRVDAEAQDPSLGRHDLQQKNLFGVVPGAVYGWPKNCSTSVGSRTRL